MVVTIHVPLCNGRTEVELSTECSFGKVSGTMEKLLASVLTKSTIHSLLTEVSQKAIESEKDTYRSCFEQGKLTKGGERKAEILYVESDSLYVHQREKDKEGNRQEYYELKSGIIYDGWQIHIAHNLMLECYGI